MSDLPPGAIPMPPDATAGMPPGAMRQPDAWKGDNRGVVSGAIMDTLGLTDRPGADTPKRVLTKPENFGEAMIPAAIAAPLVYAGGAGAGAMGLPAVLGRVAASGAIGAGQSAARGEDLSKMGLHGAVDAATAGVTEGLGSVAGKALDRVAKPLTKAIEEHAGMERAFKYATDAIDTAYDAVKDRIPKGKWFTLPSVSQTKMTAAEAFAALKKSEGDAYRIIREDIQKNLDRLDSLGRKGANFAASSAGRVFKMLTSDTRFTPPKAPAGTVGERAAKAGAEAVRSPAGRTAADAAMTAPFPGARAPIGAVAGAALADSPVLKHLPGARAVREVVEEAE